MRTAGIVICGAGIVGLTLARELVRRGHSDILILDKEPDIGRHASGRNSGVLHSGVYYSPGSLRAKSCLEGNRLMREYCREHGLPIKENGKVIVTRTEAELPALLELHRRATENGALVELIDERALAEIEPLARTVGQALRVPQTAVVDPKAILAQLRRELTDSGKVQFLFMARFTGRPGPRQAETTAGRVSYGFFINAAGAHCDRVAHAFGVGRNYRLVPFKGIYRKLSGPRADLVHGSIYPVPDIRNPFLGVHFTRGVHDDVYLGPTAIPAFGRENYGILTGVDGEAPSILWRDTVLFAKNPKFRAVALEEPRKYFFRHFFNDARKLVKELDPADVVPTHKAGIRPQLVDLGTHELVMDFLVERDRESLHVLNAISPAFTSSLFFARMLADEHLERPGEPAAKGL
ncbi:L-2-hydroxyglutarate oxidase [Desulfovibrio aminophilus]|uniref:L-2-hydroxyglutarate oxidase n=1 Tax=Desulfovibrio aminophilus TaxID=81425 RepID=UPI0003FD5563|nr:L-2-hydroxyglutarate oxidase [Desulfovibrio aminophilus]